MNPRGMVPVMRDGDFVLSESPAIVAYFDSKSDTAPLFGAGPRRAAKVWVGVSQVLSYLERDTFADIILSARATPADADLITGNATRLKAELGFDTQLAATPHVAGESLSAADLALIAFLHFNLRAAGKQVALELDLGIMPLADRWPSLAAWESRMERLPAFDRTYPPQWRG